MLWRIMKHDWRNLNADRMPLTVALLLGAAIAYGAFNGARWVEFQKAAIAGALREEGERLAGIRAEIPKIEAGEKKVSAFADPRLPQSFGRNMGLRYAVLPPGALGALAIGQSDLYPYYFKVSTNSKQTFVNSDEIENPVHLLAGRFDLAFVILYLFPLGILALSYNIVSGEKEAGTLGLTLSQPVRLEKVVMAKVALRAMFLTGLAVGLPLLGVVVGGADLAAEGAGLRLALWIGVTAAYGAFWFALAVAVNALGRSSATNAMVLAGWWLMFVVAIPAVLNVGVKAMYPVPSRVELIQAMRVAGEDATRKGSQLLARYMEDHPELAPAEKHGGGGADFGTLLMAVNDETERTVQPVLERFEQQVAGQQAMVDRWRYVSPAIAVQAALSDLAGSSGHRHRHFLKQADVFHAAWRAFLYPKIVRKEKLTVGDIDKLPAFVYREEETGEMAKRLMAILAGLLVPVLLVGWPGLVGMRRYPVAG